jgi:hypothetical protein
MSDILEQLGITREEIIDRIVVKALGLNISQSEEWEHVPFSVRVEEIISEKVTSIVEESKPMIQEKIYSMIDREVEKIFTGPFYKVNRWGDKIGEATTLRDVIADEAISYWNQKVTYDGKKSDGYGSSMPRSEFYAKKVMTDVFDKHLVSEVKKMAEELKNKIPDTISSEISKVIFSYLK